MKKKEAKKNTKQCKKSTWGTKHVCVCVEAKHVVTSTEQQGDNKASGWRQKSLKQVCL